MKKALLVIVIACLACCEQSAPKTGAASSAPKYELVLADKISVEDYSQDLRAWLNSLYEGLGYDKSDTEQELFLRSDLNVTGDGDSFPVYQSTENQRRFYVLDLGYVIDFETKKIGTLGVAGISTHYPPSKRVVVLLCPTKGVDIMGVTLGDPKADSMSPTFTENKVAF